MLNQGLGSGYLIVFHSIQSELPHGKAVGLISLCILWDLGQHDRQSHQTGSRHAGREGIPSE